MYFRHSPTLVTPILGTPTSGTLTNCTGLPLAGISDLDANLDAFLATPTSANLIAGVTDETGTGSLVFATSPTLVTPILGTPTSGTLTNCTGLPLAGISDLDANLDAFLATPTSANLIAGVTDETGTGSLVFATSPTLVTPVFSSIVNTGTLTLPTSTDTLVGRDTSDTLTNKIVQSSVNSLSATTTITVASEPIIAYTIAAADLELTLPAVASSEGLTYKVVIVASPNTNKLTVKPASGESMNGVVDDTLEMPLKDQYTTFTCVGSSWYINL